jgi:hypothetical protein
MAVRMTVSTARIGTVSAVPAWSVSAVSTRTVSIVPARSVAVPGAGTVMVAGSLAVAMGRPGRRVRGLLCRGHRPIIARTPEAHCSPRHL